MADIHDENIHADLNKINKDGITKKDILDNFQILEDKLIEYLSVWKLNSGGTTGHAIGSAIKQTEKLKSFFKDYC